MFKGRGHKCQIAALIFTIVPFGTMNALVSSGIRFRNSKYNNQRIDRSLCTFYIIIRGWEKRESRIPKYEGRMEGKV